MTKNKETMKKFEKIQKKLEEHYGKDNFTGMNKFYLKLKELYSKESGMVGEQPLGKHLDELLEGDSSKLKVFLSTLPACTRINLTLDKVINDVRIFNQMKSVCEKNKSAETFHFIEALETASELEYFEDVKTQYEEIYKKYLSSGGDLNISHEGAKAIQEFFEKTEGNPSKFDREMSEDYLEVKKKLISLVIKDSGFKTLWTSIITEHNKAYPK